MKAFLHALTNTIGKIPFFYKKKIPNYGTFNFIRFRSFLPLWKIGDFLVRKICEILNSLKYHKSESFGIFTVVVIISRIFIFQNINYRIKKSHKNLNSTTFWKLIAGNFHPHKHYILLRRNLLLYGSLNFLKFCGFLALQNRMPPFNAGTFWKSWNLQYLKTLNFGLQINEYLFLYLWEQWGNVTNDNLLWLSPNGVLEKIWVFFCIAFCIISFRFPIKIKHAIYLVYFCKNVCSK